MPINFINDIQFNFHSFIVILSISLIHSHLINYTETVNILSNIGEKQFKGNWFLSPLINSPIIDNNSSSYSYPNYFEDLTHNKGDLNFYIKFSTANKRKPNLFFELSLLDGIYKEQWIKLTAYRPFRYENFQFYFDMLIQSDNINTYNESKQYITITNEFANHTNIKLCKVIQYHKSKFMPMDNITFTLEGSPTYNKVKGNIISYSAKFNLTFNGLLISETELMSNEYKMKCFLFILAVVGLIHFFTLIVTITKQRRKKDFQFRNFSPYLTGFDMVLNCLIFINSISLSLEINSQGQGLVIISFLYFFLFSCTEGVILFFTYNFEKLSEMKYLVITCGISIITFVIIENYLFIYDMFIITFLFTSFMPQIIYNAVYFKEKTNLIPNKNIFGLILNKLYLPIYFKGFIGNVFKTKVNYMFVVLYLSIIFLQVIILVFQQKYGGDFVIPKRCRKGYYKYTANIRKVAKRYNSEFYTCNQCSICLCPFVENMQVFKRSVESKNLFRIIKERIIDKQVYIMVTPCRHFFHCECLRSWVQMKTICPICRKPIPQMSYD